MTRAAWSPPKSDAKLRVSMDWALSRERGPFSSVPRGWPCMWRMSTRNLRPSRCTATMCTCSDGASSRSLLAYSSLEQGPREPQHLVP